MRYVVSCNHKSPAYRLVKETIEVRQDRLDNRYYWSHPKYGCSKSYETPTDAINGMLLDHACYSIKIEEAQALTNAEKQARWRDRHVKLTQWQIDIIHKGVDKLDYFPEKDKNALLALLIGAKQIIIKQ